MAEEGFGYQIIIKKKLHKKLKGTVEVKMRKREERRNMCKVQIFRSGF
jgi:hypothetical protein